MRASNKTKHWQHKLVGTCLLLYRRTATYLKCTGIVSWGVKIIDYITVNDGLVFIQRRYWDLKGWTEFELWIYEERIFQMDGPEKTDLFDIFLNEALEYTIGRKMMNVEVLNDYQSQT